MARYAAVPPGNYTLQVRATDELGRWSDEITDIEVGITPYFYKSIGFYLLLVVVICLAIYLFYKRKMRSYREQKARLEKKWNCARRNWLSRTNSWKPWLNT